VDSPYNFFWLSELLPPGRQDVLHAQGTGWLRQAAGDVGGTKRKPSCVQIPYIDIQIINIKLARD